MGEDLVKVAGEVEGGRGLRVPFREIWVQNSWTQPPRFTLCLVLSEDAGHLEQHVGPFGYFPS